MDKILSIATPVLLVILPVAIYYAVKLAAKPIANVLAAYTAPATTRFIFELADDAYFYVEQLATASENKADDAAVKGLRQLIDEVGKEEAALRVIKESTASSLTEADIAVAKSRLARLAQIQKGPVTLAVNGAPVVMP